MSTPPESNLDPQSTAALEERLYHLEERLRRMQAEQQQRPGSPLERLLPPEVRTHLRAAQRERLLAVRALVDAAIKRTEEPSERERVRRPESVRID